MTDAFQSYYETYQENAAVSLNALSILLDTRSDTGDTVVASSNDNFQEAKAFRFTAQTVTDFYTPQFLINSNQCNIQAKSLNTQAFHSVTSSVNSFTRAQNMHALQSDNIYHYATNELLSAGSVIVQEAGKHYTYGDYVNVQAGNPNQQRVSDAEVGDNYGELGLGAINDITLTSKNKGILLQGKEHITAFSQGDFLVNSDQRLALTSKRGATMRSEGELAFTTESQMVLSAKFGVVINAGGILSLSGKFINIGGVSSFLGPVNLDILSIATQAASGLLSGNLSTLLTIPSSIFNYTEAFSKILPTQISGFVNSTVMSGLNSLTPGNLQNTITNLTGQTFLDAVGNLLPLNLSDQIEQYGGLISNFIPGASTLLSIFNRYQGAGYQFKQYPRIEGLNNMITSNVPEAAQSVVINNKSYGNF